MNTSQLRFLAVVVSAWLLWGQGAVAGTMESRGWIGLPAYDQIGSDIAWDGHRLWAVFSRTDHVLPGQSIGVLYELSPFNGAILTQTDIGDTNNRGLTWDGSQLWNTTYETIWGHGEPGSPPDTMLPDLAERRNEHGTLLGSLQAPYSPDAMPKGAAWDGAYLWISDSKHLELTKVDPTDGSVVASIPIPDIDPRGLAWDGMSLWCVGGDDGLIYEFDTANGNLLETWSSPATDPYGITFDGQYFWVLDNGTQRIYQFLVVPEPSSVMLLAFGVLGLSLMARRHDTGETGERRRLFLATFLFSGVPTMRRKLLLIVIVAAPGSVLSGESGVAGTLRVVRSVDFPSDYELPIARGLDWDGQHLWSVMNSTTPSMRTNDIVELDPSDGSILSSCPLRIPPVILGITWDATHLWTIIDNSESDVLLRMTRDGEPTRTIAAPHSADGRPTALTWDGSYLWVSDEAYREIACVDPTSGSVISAFPSPAVEPYGLTWDGSSLWTVDRTDGIIYQMDTAGNLLETWTSPATRPWGLTFDGEYLWLVDNDARQFIQLAVPEPSSIMLLAFGVSTCAIIAWQRLA